ncbi:MAG: ISKra4 family transposase, partial [Blastocatellia bacterium]
EISSFERGEFKLTSFGLTLAESKSILKDIQEIVVEEQATTYSASQQRCPDCGGPRKKKGSHTIPVRTLFGKVRVKSPRIRHCKCRHHKTRTFSPLAERLPERTTPELLFLETKWSTLISYGMSADLLEDVLPMGAQTINAFTIRQHLFKVAERLENSLGEELESFVEGCERDWRQLPIPDGPITVGIDGGYIRGQRKEGYFEVIAGKSMPSFRRDEAAAELDGKCFAFVQTLDTKPRRRLFELLKSQGLQENQQVVFLSDGGDDVRNLQHQLSPQAEHLLDWFHVTMRLTVMNQMAKGLPKTIGEGEDEYNLREPIAKLLESIKWYLWHGNVYQALQKIECLLIDLDGASFDKEDARIDKLLKTAREFQTYISRNRDYIPNYGERYRNGEPI